MQVMSHVIVQQEAVVSECTAAAGLNPGSHRVYWVVFMYVCNLFIINSQLFSSVNTTCTPLSIPLYSFSIPPPHSVPFLLPTIFILPYVCL